ncbi:MAG: terpene cyclase/mutase family protein [Chthoniobacter sp.]|nr:terpene cyclase/mutase family protein [Chthoniobacter sp.]
MDPKKNEKAVTEGLRWLVKTQKADGSWAPQHQAAMTGFALLAFLGHGELPVSPEFGKTVERGLHWVLFNGEKNNGRLSMESTITQQGAYAHAIVTYALGEYCTMTDGKDKPAVNLFRQAIKYIVDGQGPDGGWMYRYDKTQSDTSVTGWQLQALKVAHLSGLKIEGVDGAIEKAMQNLRRVQGPGGGFGYRGPDEKYGLTGIGVLCSTFAKEPKDMEKPIANGLKFLMTQLDANPVEYQHPTANLYAWYYNTQACMLVGAESHDAKLRKTWTEWNARFAPELINSQNADGSWPAMAAGSHENLQKDETSAGPYYRTCLSVLMLEVYYRYTPKTAMR